MEPLRFDLDARLKWSAFSRLPWMTDRQSPVECCQQCSHRYSSAFRTCPNLTTLDRRNRDDRRGRSNNLMTSEVRRNNNQKIMNHQRDRIDHETCLFTIDLGRTESPKRYPYRSSASPACQHNVWSRARAFCFSSVNASPSDPPTTMDRITMS